MTVGPILVYYPDAAEAEAYARGVRAPRGTRVHTCHDREGASRVIGEVEVLYAWGFPASLLARATRLRWVQAMGAGVDRFLTSELAAGVRLTRAPVFGPWMVEYVFGWCLWITQRMDGYRAAQRERRWTSEIPDRLCGRTLVIVGLGDIGRALARAARAFAMRVIGVSRSGWRVPGIERAYRTTEISRALAAADFAALAVPLTPETRGLLGERELGAMKPTAWLLNVARGPVVQEKPLLDALRTRRIAGAVLDVFDQEPLPPEHPLWELPNVVITPHIAGPSLPGEITAVFNANLRRYLAGRPLAHPVDRRRGY